MRVSSALEIRKWRQGPVFDLTLSSGMCEVTRRNFEEKYPQIIDDLKSASFISIDCEFSGLFDDDNKCSLFDTPKARFNKLQNYLENYIIIQFGLSTFKYERTDNTFSVASYSFYLKPSLLGNQKFMCQINSIEFLCKNQFNFNELFYNGVDYLNKSDETEILRMIEDGSLSMFLSYEEVQKYCSKVADWIGSGCEGWEMLLDLEDKSKTFVYMLHQKIRKTFPNIWTYFGENNIIKIKIVNDSEKQLLLSDKEEDCSLKKKLFDSILGFSRIIKEIQNLKKPIVGHNFLLDLIMIYKQFFNSSPVSYTAFKKSISDIFPNIYDTKVMSFRLRNFLKRDKTWSSNILSDLYIYLKEGKGSTLVIFTPLINHRNENYLNEGHFHEAGFDSFCTGFCFLKMAHMFSLWDEEKKSFFLTSMQTSSSWLIASVASMKNRVNLSRALVNHIVLNGEDPRSVRRGLLYIQSKTSLPLNIFKISEAIAKYASVDIQPLTKFNGLMAVPNLKQANEIMECFKNHEELKIEKYNFLKHSEIGRKIISSVIIAPVIFIAILASKKLLKT